MNTLLKFWQSIRSNPVFVAFEGGATGAALDFIDDLGRSGHIDFSRTGVHKFIAIAVTGGITAVRLLYRKSPTTPPTTPPPPQTKPPVQ